MDRYEVIFHPSYVSEFRRLDPVVKERLGEAFDLLRDFGPALGRPHVDTLHGSAFSNMKEIRIDAGQGVWRVAFAFDPDRNAVVLCGGDKAGIAQQRFYKTLIEVADRRFTEWIEQGSR